MIEKHNIRYEEQPVPSGEDVMWMLKTYFFCKNLWIYPQSFYHHVFDNPNSSIRGKEKKVARCLDLYVKLTRYLETKKTEMLPEYWYIKSRREFLNFLWPYKAGELEKAPLLWYLKISKQFRYNLKSGYVKLSSDEEKLYKEFTYHPMITVLKDKLYKKIGNEKYKKTKLFGITIKKKTDQKTVYLHGVVVCKKTPKYKKVYLLGLPVFYKKRNKKEMVLQRLREDNLNLYYLQKSNIQAAIVHATTFAEYKNKYCNDSVAVIGSGPTLKYYPPQKGIIKVGVNRTFLQEGLDLDYLFIQDYLKGEGDMEKAKLYHPSTCTKFFGLLSEKRYSQVRKNLKKITNKDICDACAKPYIIEDAVCRNWANFLEVEPIGDWCGCIFSALQFVLYTNPKRIYLVGCDCSDNGHFHEERVDVVNSTTLSYQYTSWVKFKEHVTRYYPSLEIISINPIGLKGLFKDVYTQSYVDKHPELKNENVEILK